MLCAAFSSLERSSASLTSLVASFTRIRPTAKISTARITVAKAPRPMLFSQPKNWVSMDSNIKAHLSIMSILTCVRRQANCCVKPTCALHYISREDGMQ